ncbi:MAG: tRNA pseudouridine(38-40) synthase TruA [Firmicutes bacterium]|nr:tRNA pseudouridine(38-40) synthase TruA [Bacillota bacterium]
MSKIKLILQYDGSDYIGWQRQAPEHGISLQQAVESALAKVVGSFVTIHGAGRTDSGVHALAQVAHFTCPVNITPQRLKLALNHILPKDIRIMAAEEVDEAFHARLSALSKVYRYLLATDELNIFNYRWYLPLDHLPLIEPMVEAAAYLIGEHDFRHFTLANSKAKSFVREVRSITVYQPNKQDLPCPLQNPLAIEVEGNGFLYKMVRLIVERMLVVGQKKLPPTGMRDFLQGALSVNLPPAPPQGLMLMEVKYGK